MLVAFNLFMVAGVKEVKRIVEMIDADAVAIHLNALQEAVQPEGQTNFKGVIAKIAEITGAIDQPSSLKKLELYFRRRC